MKKLYFLLYSTISVLGFSQTILNQSETTTRTVQDPNVVVLAQGFHATSSVSNPFVAKIGDATDSSPNNPTDSQAGTNNPSGTTSPQGTSFHDTQGSIDVNGGGQLQFTLPITLPPGIKNVAPQVSLAYTSGSGNGIAGYGWSLSGVTSISRIGKNFEKDGEVKGIQFDYSDYYSFNGQRLILKSGEYGKPGAEYVTEKHSNIKIKSLGEYNPIYTSLKGPTMFEVTFEDGSVAQYGAYSQGSTQSLSNATTPIEYYIKRWKDAQGNYITYNYSYSTGSNVAVIMSIEWGGNETIGTSHFNEILFNYEQRLSSEQSYKEGVSFTQDKILKSVVVNANGNLFRKYIIENKKESNSNYQFVEKIAVYNSNNESANPITFLYPIQTNINPVTSSVPNSDPFDKVVLTGDFNGDGYVDFLMEGGQLKLGAFNDNYSIIPINLNLIKNSPNAIVINYLVDENNKITQGNGIILYENDYVKSYVFRNNTFVQTFSKYVGKPQWCIGFPNCNLIKKLDFGDIDGDGIYELFVKIGRLEGNLFGGGGKPLGFYIIDEFVVRLKDTNLPAIQINEHREDVIDFVRNETYTDFNGDGIVNTIRIYNSKYSVFEFQKIDNNTYKKNLVFTGNLLDSQDSKIPYLFGDFNGDNVLDFCIPIADKQSSWRFYMGTGKGFNTQLKTNFLYFEKPIRDEVGNDLRTLIHNYYYNYDYNKDGKTDIIRFQTYNNLNIMNSSYRNVGYGIETRVVSSVSNGNIEFSPLNNITYSKMILGNMEFTLYMPLVANINTINYVYDFHIYWKTELIKYKSQIPLPNLLSINSIVQGGVNTSIKYEEISSQNNLYLGENNMTFPYQEKENLTKLFVVSQLQVPINGNTFLKQDFRYRGFTTHLQGRGLIGFRQTTRSSWYSDDLANTKIWSGAEIDPINEGLPIKEWSIKTNTESQIFPIDISENNTQLLTFKSTQYRFDKLLNGNLVNINNVSPSEKHNIVSATIPIKSISKDFMKNVRTESTITYDVDVSGSTKYYLPVKTISNINNSFAVSTTNLSYKNNATGTGNAYFIGRPETKEEQREVYLDTKKSKEEYTYVDNLLKTKKTYNRDNTGWFLETYQHDGFGNILQKTTTSSIDSNSRTDIVQYDSKGKFVLKKTDNLGLETNITYNNWGQILTQTDPLGIVLTNEYDGWGKLLKSKTNLGGTTTYTYQKTSDGDAIVTEYSPDGDQIISYTNKLGQNYKSTSKKFGSGQYISIITSFDNLGRETGKSEPYAGQSRTQWNTIEYDEYSRPKKATAFTGKIVETIYNERQVTTTETNANNRFKKQISDPLGNIISSEDLGGIINFKYNAAGQNLEANYGGNIVKTSYDVWGNKVRFEDPSNGVYTYEYNGYMGAISKTKNPKGIVKYAYNNKGQLIEQRETTGKLDMYGGYKKIINFTYNNKGLITKKYGISLGKPYNSTIAYDSYGRVLSSSEDSNGKYFMKKGIAYDDKMRVTTYEKSLYSSGVLTKVNIENVYDSWNGELYQIKEKNTGKVLWELQQVNDKGQVTQAKLGSTNIINTYATNGFLNNINHTSAKLGNTILQIGYSFNAIKNELNSRTTGGDFNILEQFVYDDNNRLVNWTDPATGTFTQNQNRNVYDTKGRITFNDHVGNIKFGNTQKLYQATGMTLNTSGTNNYSNDLIQSVQYNENNDPLFIDGEKGDVAFEYGLASMRQRVTYGGNFGQEEGAEGRFTKYYSEDGSFEIIRNNQTGQEKHLIYIGGSPYESNIVYLKEFTTTTPKFVFLHKDYIGSVLAITDDAGNKLEQRHFDAWGNLTHLKIGSNAIITDKNQIRDYLANGNLVIDRGYTSHEHFAEVGIIHMNGRLYDPLLRRFLNADENIQDPYNTQNYNKYGYVMNNPLMYNDPSGEVFILPMFAAMSTFWGVVATGAVIGAAIGASMYALMAWNNQNWNWSAFGKSIFMGFFTGAASSGLGQVFSATGFWATVGNGALAGAGSGGLTSIINGTNFLEGLVKGGVIGGAVAGISYTINYYTNSNTQELTKAEYDSYGIPDDSGSLDPSVETLRKTFKDNKWDKMNTGAKQFYVDKVSNGYKKSGDLYINTKGETVIAYTRRNFWDGNTSSISFSKHAFGSKIKLGFVMMHELGHSTINLSSLNDYLQFKTKNGYEPEMLPKASGLDKISVEHGATWGIERDFLKLNGLDNLPGFFNPQNEGYFNTYFLKSQQYQHVYDAIKHLPVKLK